MLIQSPNRLFDQGILWTIYFGTVTEFCNFANQKTLDSINFQMIL